MTASLPPVWARVAAALGTLAFFVLGTTSGSLANSTDAIYGVVAADIAERGAWLVPEVAGGPYLMKPPIYFWMVALSVKLFGATAFAFRLPGVLSGFVVALACAGIVGRLTKKPAGWFAGLGFALLSPTVFEFSRRVFMEETLAAAMMVALYATIRARDEDDPRWLWMVGLASSVAILTKSYGGGFSGVAILAWLPLVGRAKWLISKPFLGGIALGSIPILGYVAVMMMAASEPFLHQNLLPFRMGSAEQFSWYRTGRFFYFTKPASTDTLVFLGGLAAFGVGSWMARAKEELRGIWLLGLYVGVGYAVWGSLEQQRLYYMVPFLPAFSCALAAVVASVPVPTVRTALIAVAFGLAPLIQAPLFSPDKLDPEPALATLGPQVAQTLGEGDVVYRYNDFFAASELYFDRRAIGLTPSEEMLRDFGRILVLGERDIARDGRPAALFELYWAERDAGNPFHLVADARSLALIRGGMPDLKPRLSAPDPARGTTLWFASTDDALPEVEAELNTAGYPVALSWLAANRPQDLLPTLARLDELHGPDALRSFVEAAGLTMPEPKVRPVDTPGSEPLEDGAP